MKIFENISCAITQDAAFSSQMKNEFTPKQKDLFELCQHITSEEIRLRDDEKAQAYYAQEWGLKVGEDRFERLAFLVFDSLEQRGESAMCKFAEAMGITFEEANQLFISLQ